MNSSAALAGEAPLGVMTVTSTVAAACLGDCAVIWVSESTVKALAALVPKSTTVAPVKLEPVIVTVVPPAGAPTVGLTPVMSGIA